VIHFQKKAQAYSIPGVTVDGTDPLAVYDVVKTASERARAGQGPSLIESKFYRLSAHGNAITVPPVPTQFPKHEAVEVYGRKAEYDAAKANDPIPKFRSKLIAAGVLADAEANGIEEKVRAEMEEAVRFGLASPQPSPEDALKHVYA
jgi:TPP-dependent pyruvate/acetoin dehydrogenase alpha subunit